MSARINTKGYFNLATLLKCTIIWKKKTKTRVFNFVKRQINVISQEQNLCWRKFKYLTYYQFLWLYWFKVMIRLWSLKYSLNNSGFLTFSGSMEMKDWPELVLKILLRFAVLYKCYSKCYTVLQSIIIKIFFTIFLHGIPIDFFCLFYFEKEIYVWLISMVIEIVLLCMTLNCGLYWFFLRMKGRDRF